MADEKVTLGFKDRPAGEALTALARHFDFTWYRRDPGYEISQSSDSMRREAALVERHRNEQLAGIQEQMETLRRFQGLTKEQREARQKEIQEHLRRMAGKVDPEFRRRASQEMNALFTLDQPGSGSALAIYFSLAPAQLAQLRQRGELRLATADGSLPAPMAQAVHQAHQEQRDQMQRNLESLPAEVARPSAPPEGPATGATVTLRLDAASSGVYVSVSPTGATAPPVSGSRMGLSMTMTSLRGGTGRPPAQPVSWRPYLSISRPPNSEAPPRPDDPALNKEVDLGFTLPKAAAQTEDERLRSRIFSGGGRLPPSMVPLSEVLERLHRESGFNVVGDSYVRARVEPSALVGRRTVRQILDLIGKRLAYTWQREEQLLRLRSDTYFLERPREVPEKVLRPLRSKLTGPNPAGLALDDYASLAAALPDPQLLSLQDYWNWYLDDGGRAAPSGPGFGSTSGIYTNRHHLRFWASLTATQKRAAVGGQPLPVGALSPPQQQRYVTALATEPDPPFGIQASITATAAELAGGDFRMQSREYQQQFYVGTGPEGQKMSRISTPDMGRQGAPGGPFRGAWEGTDWKAVGSPVTLESFSFRYHIGGRNAPARAANISVPRPEKTP